MKTVATKRARQSLTFQHGQYRAMVGYWLGKDGQGPRRPKHHMLGPDLGFAHVLLKWLKHHWEIVSTMVAYPDEQQNEHGQPLSFSDLVEKELADPETGKPIWSQFSLDLAQQDACDEMKRPMPGGSMRFIAAKNLRTPEEWRAAEDDPRVVILGAGDPPQTVTTFGAVVQAYDDHLEARRGVDLGDDNRFRQRETLRSVKELIGEDWPMDRLDYDKLSALTNELKKRFANDELAFNTVRTTLQHLKQMLVWSEDSGRWVGPRRWERLFKFAKPRNAKVKQDVMVFTAEEIGQLYAACTTDRETIVLALGLNLAATQKQLSQLSAADLVNEHGQPLYFDLQRGKTGVPAVYDCWSTTETALLNWIEHHSLKDPIPNPERLLIRSEGGKPLVHFSSKGNKTDSVKLVWNRLLEKSGLPKHRRFSFSALRDTTSAAMRRLGGKEIQRQVLAHAEGTVARVHYTEDKLPKSEWDAMNAAMKRWHDEEIVPAIRKAVAEAQAKEAAGQSG